MNKNDLISSIAESAGITRATAEAALNGFTGAIEEALTAGETVALTGFGSFSVATRAARTGRNPQSGQEITIAAKKVVKFKPGKKLAEELA